MQRRSSGGLGKACCGSESALDVGDDVVNVLDADRKPDIAVRHTSRFLLFLGELGVGGAGGMDRKAARLADVGDVIEQLQCIDEAPPRLATAGEFESDEPAEAALEVAIGAFAEDAS